MLKITPTPWKCQDTPHDPDFTHEIFANDYTGIASIHMADERGNYDAEAIVSAVNGTYGVGIRPESVKLLFDALEEAALQIEYLSKKFTPTGSGNAVLLRCRTIIEQSKL